MTLNMRKNIWILILFSLILYLVLTHVVPGVWVVFTLARLPFVWARISSRSLITEQRDGFDLTFASYPIDQTASNRGADAVPAVLHHINLGPHDPRPEWLAARAECLRHHQTWTTYLWNDSNAGDFVRENFPHLKDMWDHYRYPVQRVDALRYMLLYTYGGAVLDFDLSCKRSLEPLRRFAFVAPAAHPTGFSIGMLMASPQHPLVGDLVNNLPIFNRAWLGLPYTTVMFSTGCHYASSICARKNNRKTRWRLLAGPPTDKKMHTLNGHVETPLFKHLGSSSWHSFDGRFIYLLGKVAKSVWMLILMALALLIVSFAMICYHTIVKRRCRQAKGERGDEVQDMRAFGNKKA